MTKKTRDTDYLAVSAYVRARENALLTAEDYERLIAAKTDDEAEQLLRSHGYGALDARRPAALDAALGAARQAAFDELTALLPDAGELEIFKLPYDYHNLKTLLKAEAMRVSPDALLSDLGRVSPAALAETLRAGTGGLPGLLDEAAAEARAVLDATRDPQLADAALDACCFRDLTETAARTGSAFLADWTRLRLDAANLRTLVRALRMGKGADFLRGVLPEGGDVGVDELLRVGGARGDGLAALYAPTRLASAAEAGAAALQGGALTAFERACDDALSAYLADARLIPFGEAPVLAYLAARETEYTNLRVILMGRAARVPAEVLRERLRAVCV